MASASDASAATVAAYQATPASSGLGSSLAAATADSTIDLDFTSLMSVHELESSGTMHFLQVFTPGLGEAPERQASMWQQQHQTLADDAMGDAAAAAAMAAQRPGLDVTSAELGRLDPGLCSTAGVAAKSAATGASRPQRLPSHVVIAASPTRMRSGSLPRQECHPSTLRTAGPTSAKRAKSNTSEEQEDILCPLCGGKGRNGPTR